MQLRKLLEKWDLTSLKIKLPFLETEWEAKDEDKSAAWELYVEMLTRVSTQRLALDAGHEPAALSSIYQLFPLTREIIKRHGRYCINFSKIAVVVLNQKVRPFTTKWHSRIENGPLSVEQLQEFRSDLLALQNDLRRYTHLLADMADVEDITDLEAEERPTNGS